ncbi:MAG: hypothetical protein L0Z53_09035, partial [Acidobacteriales bacterium]|nr:hypothetical protein [Terriglobales bacterium]
ASSASAAAIASAAAYTASSASAAAIASAAAYTAARATHQSKMCRLIRKRLVFDALNARKGYNALDRRVVDKAAEILKVKGGE